MKKITKQLFSVFTVFVLSIGLFASLSSFEAEAATTYTSGDWAYTVSDGVATLTGYTGTATNLTLPTSLGGYAVKYVGQSIFKDNTMITSVVIPEGYKEIQYYAFMNCSYLKSVTIPKSIEKIGTGTYNGQAFADCIRLETVNFVQGGTVEAEMFVSAFGGCTALKSVTIPANYKNIAASAFSGCTNLKTVVIEENTDPYFERSIDYRAFVDCTSLTAINIPEGFVTIGDYAFMGCSNLKSVNIPKSMQMIGTGDYTGSSFSNCIRLETINFVEGGTAELEMKNSSFSGCTALKSVTIPANYKNIAASAFSGCTNLKTVVIEENTDPYFDRTIDYRAFYDCTSLTLVHIPEIFSSIEETAFDNCSSSLVICSTSSAGVAKTYADNNSIIFKVCDGTHEAKESETYTLFYNANGGTGAPSSQSGAVSYTVSSTVPVRDGYTFLGWSKSSSASSASYASGNIITLTANTVLYAVWHKNAVITPPVIENTVSAYIRKPSTTTISYGDSIVLHAEVDGTLPDGAYIKWETRGNSFDVSVSSDGTTCQITPRTSGDTMFTVIVVDANGDLLNPEADSVIMTSKAGFFDKIIAFFKSLFGLTKTIPQIYKGIM